ncbi:hypothetical protein AV530_002218 [Patagioenas fasciata monilis]|uniref:Uncharacterized protein n=1 Tax=Patagioenas fasciata monilis TaxID=372326 RepID=A0A1V4K5Q3_PATFA|nr:hypothetical protein AV530_002218 [Patagioenas fasciata monilis]
MCCCCSGARPRARPPHSPARSPARNPARTPARSPQHPVPPRRGPSAPSVSASSGSGTVKERNSCLVQL